MLIYAKHYEIIFTAIEQMKTMIKIKRLSEPTKNLSIHATNWQK